MQIKSSIKIGILFILIIAITVVGCMMFRKIDHNKKVFEKEITTMIPSSVSVVLQINKDRRNNITTNSSNKLGVLIDSIKTHLTYPLYIIGDEEKSAIIAKITDQQESDLKDLLSLEIFPSYPPKVKKYNDTDILFYATTDNYFFCCTFNNGVFIGAYNYKLIEECLKSNVDTNFFNDSTFKGVLSKIKTNYSANLYLNDSKNWSAFNISFDEDSIILDGYTGKYGKSYSSNEDLKKDDYIINRNILPNNLIAYQVNTSNNEISDSLKNYFSLPTYQFYTDTTMQAIYALRLNVDKFVIYNYLNDLETKYIGKKLGTRDFAFGDQRIYTASAPLSKSLFNKDELVYLTFYKNYLIYSISKKELISYLINNGKNENTVVPDIVNNDSIQTESISYYSKLKKTTLPPYLLGLKQVCMLDSIQKSIFVKIYWDNNVKKINIILNN